MANFSGIKPVSKTLGKKYIYMKYSLRINNLAVPSEVSFASKPVCLKHVDIVKSEPPGHRQILMIFYSRKKT
jgi:hypothetical protein